MKLIKLKYCNNQMRLRIEDIENVWNKYLHEHKCMLNGPWRARERASKVNLEGNEIDTALSTSFNSNIDIDICS